MIPPKKEAPPPHDFCPFPGPPYREGRAWKKAGPSTSGRSGFFQGPAQAGSLAGSDDGWVRKAPALPAETPRKTLSPRAAGQADRRQRPLEEEKAAAGRHSLL